MSATRNAMGLMLCALLMAGCSQDDTATDASRDGPAKAAPEATDTRPVAAPTPTPALKITQVRADQLRFDPAKDESVTVRFNIDEEADVGLTLYDGRDRRVRLIEGGKLPAGEHSLSWDGRDHKNRVVPPEAYTYTLTAVTAKGGQVTHDLTDVTGGEALPVKDVRWDPDAGTVHYHLDEPARVNIRFGLQEGGPYLRTLIDWVPRIAGAQSEAWDGWDASKVLPLARHPKLATGVMAYTLSDNTVFVGPRTDQVTFAELPDQYTRERQPPKGPKRMYHHADQPLETRGDVSASLTLDGTPRQDTNGRWVVSGRVPVRLNVSDADRTRVLTRRFEPVFFIDGIYAFENEVGFLPMTWNWDTTTVNAGEHFVTVNVRGYDGNFGTATLKVWVEHPPAGDKTP